LGNVFDGEVVNDKLQMKTQYGLFAVECSHKHAKGDKVKLLFRASDRLADSQSAISGIVRDVIFQQDRFKVIFDNGLYVYLDQEPKLGEKISVKVKLECLG
jgi:hypothetical protein